MGRSPYLVSAALIVVGIGLIAGASCRPQYNDPNWHGKLYGPRWSGRHADADVDAWLALRATLLTARGVEQDIGVAIAGLGIGLAAVMADADVRVWADLPSLRTPPSRRQFRWLAALVWLSFVPSAWVFYICTSIRGDYSPIGDIVFIPCVGVAIFGVIGLPVVLLGATVATAGRPMPVSAFGRGLRCAGRARYRGPFGPRCWQPRPCSARSCSRCRRR